MFSHYGKEKEEEKHNVCLYWLEKEQVMTREVRTNHGITGINLSLLVKMEFM